MNSVHPFLFDVFYPKNKNKFKVKFKIFDIPRSIQIDISRTFIALFNLVTELVVVTKRIILDTPTCERASFYSKPRLGTRGFKTGLDYVQPSY